MTTSALDQARTDEESERHSTPAEGIGAGRPFAWLLVICGALGLLASWVITFRPVISNVQMPGEICQK